eukprot:822960-Pleurochrysis_carterae.AAC.1
MCGKFFGGFGELCIYLNEDGAGGACGKRESEGARSRDALRRQHFAERRSRFLKGFAPSLAYKAVE